MHNYMQVALSHSHYITQSNFVVQVWSQPRGRCADAGTSIKRNSTQLLQPAKYSQTAGHKTIAVLKEYHCHHLASV